MMALPNFWTSHIAQALVGEQPCLLRVWLGARFKYPRRNQDQGTLANWKANHTALLGTVADDYRAKGWKCQIEKFYRVEGKSAVLTGKADLIVSKTDHRSVVVDTKSGEARESDAAQVMVEMIAIPMFYGAPAMLFDGEVRYAGSSFAIPNSDTIEFKPKLFGMLRQLGEGSQRPEASPGKLQCRFCDVPDSECSVRWKEENDSVAVTGEF